MNAIFSFIKNQLNIAENSNHSEEELLEQLGKTPEVLDLLFSDLVDNQNLLASASFDFKIKLIRLLRKTSCGESQIKSSSEKISSASKHIFHCQIDKVLGEIKESDLSEKNIQILLEVFEQTQHESLRDICFKFIKEKSGIDLTIPPNGKINAEISDFKDPETIIKYLSFFTSSKLEIYLNPARKQEIVKIEEIAKAFGDGELENIESAKLGAFPKDMDFDVIKRNLASWQQYFIEDPYGDTFKNVPDELAAFHSIASGMRCSAKVCKDIRSKGPEALQKAIDGEFSKEKFFASFEFDAKLPCEFKSKFQTWSTQLSDEGLKKFLAYATGSPTLPTKKIAFKVTDYGGLMARACISVVEIGIKGIQEWIDNINEKRQKKWTFEDFVIDQFNQIAEATDQIKFNRA